MLFQNIALLDQTYALRMHQYVATQGKTITYIGDQPPDSYDGEMYDGQNKIMLPGFFNLHCHIPMTLIRGYGEGLPLHRWLQERMLPFESLMNAEDMYWGAMLGMAEMLRSGAVSFTDMYMKVEGILRAVDQAGMKANLCNAAIGFDDDARFVGSGEWKDTRTIREFAKTAGHDRILPEVGLHAEYTTRERMVRDVAEFAAAKNLRIQLHLSETRSEHEECKQRHAGKTPTQWFAHCGALDVPVTAAHAVHVEEEDLAILAEKGVTVAHCPSSNLKLGSGIARIDRMIEKGVAVGIGTDGAASNNNLNMLEEITLASMLQKGISGNPVVFGPAQMLEMACKAGAHAQGRADCGVLRTGYRADLIVIDLHKPHLQPVFDPLANVFYSAQAEDVCLTMVDGKVLYRDGAYTTIDIEQVLFHAARIKQEKLVQLNK